MTATAHLHPRDVDAEPVEREAVEEYARRLACHRERIADDLDSARLRLAWRAFERGARRALGANDACTLRTIGVLGDDDANDPHLIARRTEQLAAVDRLIAYTAAVLDRHPTQTRAAAEALDQYLQSNEQQPVATTG